jgi:hypothetical protein
MMAVQSNKVSGRAKRQRSALKIRFRFVDGSAEAFAQADARVAQHTLRQINPAHLFNQSRIVVADDYSKSVFVCSAINRVDFAYEGLGFPEIPPDHADLVELTAAEFHKFVPLHEPARLERREQRRNVGDLLVSFLNLRMRGGAHVYFMNEVLVKLPAESQSYMARLLSKGALVIRLAGGGEGILNLANLIGYTVYPGVAEVPADTWIARPASDS